MSLPVLAPGDAQRARVIDTAEKAIADLASWRSVF